ncbi:MAG: DUF1080 domain-containing protein, partial [Cyclobacteriaceae bacterium]|nr:DUF1080 domain-containing protein [Cyclobacteriaceae bacterium]
TDFRPQAGNWMIVGDVTINPDVDIHEKPAAPPPQVSKKSRKAATPVTIEKPQAVTFSPGTGVLLNMNNDTRKSNLVSVMEHGDIDLELEVMLPKGSNSGIYLQGRYEVQLLDSWGVKDPKYSDIGGIYRNWENEPGKIYMGKAPLSNPAKAPGLWQKFKISFRAPRFNATGEKIQNARFNYVDLNGVRIHENYEVPLPTGGPIENNEKAMGPLMIQGDHGPVAFRNVKYLLMKEVEVSLSDITYQTWYGNYKLISEYVNQKPAAVGTMNELTCEVLENENAYGTAYKGTLTVSEDAEYNFIFAYTGGGRLVINNQQLSNYQSPDGWWRNDQSTIALKAGRYPIEIYNYKDASWMPPRLALFVQTGSTPKALHAFNSFPPDDQPVAPILINPGNEPRMLRAFIDYKGDYKQRLTHTIGVGDPSGTHYVYDLKAGNLVCVWKGDFADATPMWHDRGDGSFKPMGSVLYLFNNQPLAFLPTETNAFPVITREAEIKPGEYRGKGYEIDTNGRPVFKYTFQGMQVEDKIYPDNQGRIITHEVNIKERGTKDDLFYKVAEGKNVKVMPNGDYAIDDKSYYIRLNGGINGMVREINGVSELMVPVTNSFSYSIIW